eukprot:1149296-Prorocentrum_lima.AAC.1
MQVGIQFLLSGTAEDTIWDSASEPHVPANNAAEAGIKGEADNPNVERGEAEPAAHWPPAAVGRGG